MPTLITSPLTKKQTQLVIAGRSRVSSSTIGSDMFAAIGGQVTDAEYNTLADGFNALQANISYTYANSGTVSGTKDDNSNFAIDDDPSHPLIIHRPGS